MKSVGDSRYTCTGCRVCEEFCPKKCIKIEESLLGHIAIVDEEKCIGCGKCTRICPVIHQPKYNIIEANVGVHTDNDEILRSSSGGAFWALCQTLIPLGYKVAGVKWNTNFKAIFTLANTLDECQQFRKSKYVYANTNGIFQEVAKSLKRNEDVMFVGLPCQVAACKNAIGDNPHLLLVDLICHGAPVQEMIDREIDYLKRKYKTDVTGLTFKGKKLVYGHYNSRSCVVRFSDGRERVFSSEEDPFLRGYYKRLINRQSCGTCSYACSQRTGDITLGDAWGIEKLYSDLNPLYGVSLVLFNTEKGLRMRDYLLKNVSLRHVDVEWAIHENEQLRQPTKIHEGLDRFVKLLSIANFETAVFNVCPLSFRRKVRLFFKKLLSQNKYYYERFITAKTT